jgi:hypothetical protein
LCNPGHQATLSVNVAKAHDYAGLEVVEYVRTKSDTLARRISTAGAQEMQKAADG